ncbi:hypothetical protein [Botryobacter ruber]|uniref:hypothetical protein n=1 Tax=Botryobacter ruber TaxID=2171629 RepID=UPI000E0AF63A|nr:hypothetical protein [Botryobacter ruber]
MKNYWLFSSLFLVLLLLSFSACQKEEDKEPSKTDMITAHSWQGEQVLVLGTDVATNPLFSGLLPDITTMTLTFNRNGTYNASYVENGQTIPVSGNWEFRDNETSVFFDLLTTFGLNETLSLKELSADKLQFSTTVNIAGFPGSLPVDVHFVKK